MISRSTFLDIRERFGLWASWAVWAEAGVKPKDNMGDLSVFDLERYPGVLNELHADVILVGLNFSRGQSRIWGNFHDPRPVATDYKTRHALKGTWLWGAYMTAVIKDKVEKRSGSLVRYLGAGCFLELKNTPDRATMSAHVKTASEARPGVPVCNGMFMQLKKARPTSARVR